MKRSRSIRLVLLGGISAGALTSCGPGGSQDALSPNCVYTNNYYVAGVGYYHAPFRAWYSLPYNHYDQQTLRFFYGGQWGTLPHQSITNISSPTTEAAQRAQATRTDIKRGGFGRSSYFHSTYS